MNELAPDLFLLHVGIDIASKKASVAWLTATGQVEPAFEIFQTATGMAGLRQRLLSVCPDVARIHVMMEVTANYHVHLAHFLHEHGFQVSVVNPLQARRFVEVFLKREKTDAIDALMLAQMGQQMALRRWTPPPPLYEELQQRIIQRAALVKMHANTINRQKSRQHRIAEVEAVEVRSKELLLLLRRHIAQIEKEFASVLKQDPTWAATAKRITSIPGVGIATAAWLIMLTNNFAACDSASQLAAFIGLVPYRRQSGTSLNTYLSIGHVGHDDVRHHLYSATLSALRYNPVIKAYYDQLRARRKSHRLATIAAARKLIHLIWAIAHSDQSFDPDYAVKHPKQSRS
jgi:transposase